MTRTRFARVLATPLLGVLLAAAPVSPQEIALVPVVSGLTRIIEVASAGDGSGRLFIGEQGGAIRIFDGNELLPVPFLDLSSKISCCGEQGVLGLAFHPDYTSNGYFYVDYTDTNGDTVIERYSVSADPDVADASSELTILVVPQDFTRHNGGKLAFGADGYLYIAIGDGGLGGDPNNRAQGLDTLLGKIVRIDVDRGMPYAIPADNPYVGIAGLDEIWATGLRNPWRFSFDRDNGDLFIADVGESGREEVNYQGAGSSGCENYGWRRMEGSLCFNPGARCSPGVSTGCNPRGRLELPIIEYAHSHGDCSITGGFRYRGDEVPMIAGFYLYADFCSGRIWGARLIEILDPPQTEGGPPSAKPAPTALPRLLLDTTINPSTFGEDEDGELYLADYGGTVYRIVAPLSLSPGDGRYGATQEMDLMVRLDMPHASVSSLTVEVSGEPLSGGGRICGLVGSMESGGSTFRCPDFSKRLSPGRHLIEARAHLVDGRILRATAIWWIEANRE